MSQTFRAAAQSALESRLSSPALLLIFDAAARRREPHVAARALLVSGDHPEVVEQLWEHPYAPTASLSEHSAIDSLGDMLGPRTLAVFGRGVIAALDSMDPADRPWSAPPQLLTLVSLAHLMLHPEQYEEFEPATVDAAEAAELRSLADLVGRRDLVLELFRSTGSPQHLRQLLECVSDRDAYLAALLPTLGPDQPEDASLLTALVQLDGLPPSTWLSLPWGPLRGERGVANAYAARLFDAVAEGLETDEHREAFAVMSERWAGSVEQLIVACHNC